MPVKKCLKCLRCGKDFDARFAKERLCQIPHPYDCVNTEWRGSKVSWDHCSRCGKDFHEEGHRKRGRDCGDVGDYCFEGEHTTDQRVVDREEETYGEL